ncbi:class I adenylate-forming enzyme family protein [Paenibacillus sp. PL2-23]|uniref:class I adenylate-forming enzyme family protein n=1 Tax=Paenibacillus sp. PL2-23 TaxID=2100729 RepID=UPI0030F82C11
MYEVSNSIARWASRSPERPAVIDELAALSYAELHERANRWAGALHEAGFHSGAGIIVLLPNRVECIEVMVALFRADVVPFFLNTNVAKHKAEDLLGLAAATEARLLITTRDVADEMAFSQAEAPFQIWTVDDLDLSRQAIGEIPPPRHGTDMVLFTSGSTGSPKGIILSKSAFDLGLQPNGEFVEPKQHLLVKPLASRGSISTACNILQEGNTVVLSRVATPDAWMKLMENHHISFVKLGPSELIGWLEHLERNGRGLPSSVRHIMSNGEPLTQALKARIGKLLPHIRVTDLYGTSEVGAITMIEQKEWALKDGSCGRPIFFVSLKIVGEQNEELPPGEIGEIWVKTRYRMKEYYQNAGATNETIQGDYVKTGDLGFLDKQGYLYLRGRKQDVIRRGEHRIFPAEVEDVLREANGVEAAVVIGRNSPEHGQEPVAYILMRDSKLLSTEGEAVLRNDILAHCEERLASYQIPAEMWFVQEIPLNAAGKADRLALAQAAAALQQKAEQS